MCLLRSWVAQVSPSLRIIVLAIFPHHHQPPNLSVANHHETCSADGMDGLPHGQSDYVVGTGGVALDSTRLSTLKRQFMLQLSLDPIYGYLEQHSEHSISLARVKTA